VYGPEDKPLLPSETAVFDKIKSLLARLRDPIIRALWTFLYVFVGALAVEFTPLGDTLDVSVAQAALIAAGLAAVKTILTLRFGDPLAIKANLSDYAVRLFHTAWQSLLALFLAGNLSLDRASLTAAAVAVILNAIRVTVLPPLPTNQPVPIDGNQDGPAPEPEPDTSFLDEILGEDEEDVPPSDDPADQYPVDDQPTPGSQD
jgi:hypothetical protein